MTSSVVDQDARGVAAQPPAIDDEIVTGEDRLIGDDRAPIRGLRLEEIDHRLLEGHDREIARAHRQGRSNGTLAFDQND